MKRVFKLITVLAVIAVTNAETCMGQDHHLSQYFKTQMYINPATTALLANYDYKFSVHHRSQWGFLNKSFLTDAVFVEKSHDRFGFGAYVLNDHAGTTSYNTFNFVASASYEVTESVGLSKNAHNLFCGVQLGLLHNSFNPNKATWDSHWDQANSIYSPNYGTTESFASTSETKVDANFGLYYYNRDKRSIFKTHIDNSGAIMPFYVGVSGFHLWEPRLDFLGQRTRLYRRYLVHFGGMVRINKDASVEPKFMYERQANNNEFLFGALGHYFTNDKKYHFSTGLLYRTQDALVWYLGGNYKEFGLGFSYDINTSSLRTATNGNGGYELSIIYMIPGKGDVPLLTE